MGGLLACEHRPAELGCTDSQHGESSREGERHECCHGPLPAGNAGADYSIPGNTVNRVMNGFNAIGIGESGLGSGWAAAWAAEGGGLGSRAAARPG